MIDPAKLINRDYADPADALNQCYDASLTLLTALARFGMTMDDAALVGLTADFGDVLVDGSPAKNFFDDYQDFDDVGHYVVRVGSVYVDLTARQFWPDSPYPMIVGREWLERTWRKIRERGGYDNADGSLKFQFDCGKS